MCVITGATATKAVRAHGFCPRCRRIRPLPRHRERFDQIVSGHLCVVDEFVIDTHGWHEQRRYSNTSAHHRGEDSTKS